ncbi:hypothetical protein CupriaWKF_10220 [Cupriavidus sp. WKF15]|uniref:hypothetical protein n=1 Tax=Cupriavidus sp. WKF15 TaxID=3032282 RepID=UPI0023E26C33|nr:hypothetical protein [Cupriavidus sp. WKF15]WER44718.1 hypothetical protein CupriaWKF_10220 [Cupriavidus sp. WKF15]
MVRKIVPILTAASLAALGTQVVHAQKNYTDGGDLYGGSHAAKSKTQNQAKAGKPDPYTDGAKQSTKAGLAEGGNKPDTGTSAARSGKFDPYSEGAKSGKFDPYTEGVKKPDEKAQ